MSSTNKPLMAKSTTTARCGITDFTRKPHKTYLLITGTVAIIGILHLLPNTTQHNLAQLIKSNTWLLGVILVACLTLTYFNWIAGLLILFLIICVVFPLNVDTHTTNPNIEGFKSSDKNQKTNKQTNDISLNNKHIKSLFEPGLFGKRIDEYRTLNKQIKEENKAREKSIEVINSARAKKLGENNTGRQREDFKEIALRKFDPTNEEDMNLLLTMEHCADIQNRIKFVYEDNKYLKKYIKDKLEDIVDLLDLVPDDTTSA